MPLAADNTKKTPIFGGVEASVNEIIDSIIQNGEYSSEFNEQYERYCGGGAPMAAGSVGSLFDRRGEQRSDVSEEGLRQTVEYEDGDNMPGMYASRTEHIIAQSLPPEQRDAFARTQEEAKKPEFTSRGTVRYPVMGSGESEERVVFDADWEAKAKADVARREQYRREKALRGDSTYARTFVTEGYSVGKRNAFGYQPGYYAGRPTVNPNYIDPLSNDDEPEPEERLQGAGFLSRKKNRAAGGYEKPGESRLRRENSGEIPFSVQRSETGAYSQSVGAAPLRRTDAEEDFSFIEEKQRREAQKKQAAQKKPPVTPLSEDDFEEICIGEPQAPLTREPQVDTVPEQNAEPAAERFFEPEPQAFAEQETEFLFGLEPLEPESSAGEQTGVSSVLSGIFTVDDFDNDINSGRTDEVSEQQSKHSSGKAGKRFRRGKQ